ncbi:MAG TPA: non-homologous end-joining DNA ligase [Pyrinomonadaceae bacterium]|nr:non-homologous end-joining DNA ligase [Pyrinomonadaceae bacterium]
MGLRDTRRGGKTSSTSTSSLSQNSTGRFVVHEHHASVLHFDFRLEIAGTLKSWAVPKGPSLDPRHRRLAVAVPDHAVSYINFEGTISEGSYGAGEVRVWDKGTFVVHGDEDALAQLGKGKLRFSLRGAKLRGEFVLLKMQGRDKQWLLIKSRDDFAEDDWHLETVLAARVRQRAPRAEAAARTSRRRASQAQQSESALYLDESQTLPSVPGARPAPMPARVDPMLATLVDAPFSDPDWIYETKWDGVRALCYIEAGRARFISRNDKDMSFRYPELAEVAARLNAEQAILDGEIVAFDERGRPSFQLLQSRVGLKDEAEIARLAATQRVAYCAFDLVYYNGFDLRPAALLHRKALLEELIEESDALKYSAHTTGDGEREFRRAARLGLEGIMAKHQGSTYHARRSNDWLKIKTQLRQEVVIAGYTAPRGARPLFGALVVGLHDDEGRLRYVGHVGGGFNRETLEQTYRLMSRLQRKTAPFDEAPPTNEPVQWVKPSLVCEVKFAEWTADRKLRQPIFIGLRDDKEPAQCTFERMRRARREVAEVDERLSAEGSKNAPPPRRAAKGRKR